MHSRSCMTIKKKGETFEHVELKNIIEKKKIISFYKDFFDWNGMTICLTKKEKDWIIVFQLSVELQWKIDFVIKHTT